MGGFTLAIIGAGAVGGYFAAALSRSGTWVGLIARGDHIEAIRRSGLHVRSPAGDFVAVPARISADPVEIGPVDAVIVTVKAWQLREAAEIAKHMLKSASRILPVQNGVEAATILRESIGPELVLDGTCRIVSERIATGQIRHIGVQPTVHFGEADGGDLSPTSQRLRDALTTAGIIVHTPQCMRIALWEKLHFLAPLSAVASVSRSAIGTIRSNGATFDLVMSAMREVASVAQAVGVVLPEDAIACSQEMFQKVPDETTVSMQRDIEAGRPSELDAIVGVIVRFGRQHRVPTPVMETLYAVLLPQELRARAFRSG